MFIPKLELIMTVKEAHDNFTDYQSGTTVTPWHIAEMKKVTIQTSNLCCMLKNHHSIWHSVPNEPYGNLVSRMTSISLMPWIVNWMSEKLMTCKGYWIVINVMIMVAKPALFNLIHQDIEWLLSENTPELLKHCSYVVLLALKLYQLYNISL